MDIRQETRVTLQPEDFKNLHLSVPAWADLSLPENARGWVRHGVNTAVSHVASRLKVSYADHAKALLESGSSELLMWGTRNSFQNLLLPVYQSNMTPALLCRCDEPWKTTEYHALVKQKNRGLSLQKIRFMASGDEPVGITVEDDFSARGRDGIEWAVVGQPLLWDAQPVSKLLIAGMTYDLRHKYRLKWEQYQQHPDHAAIHHEMMKQFMQNLARPAMERGAILEELAAKYGLQTEDGYLHSTLGLSKEKGLILIAKHGSLEDLGDRQRQAGAERAILLDNGGSVGYAVFERSDSRPRFFGNGSYFRPQGHATLVAVLTKPLRELPFQ